MTRTTPPVALVTGASTSIGWYASAALDKAGFLVVGTNRNIDHASFADGVLPLSLDVTDNDSVTAAVKQVIDQHGKTDILVNNAGMGNTEAFEENSVDNDMKIIDLNIMGVIWMIKAVLPYMRARRSGRILNASSVPGLTPQPFMAVYSATKYAIEGLSEAIDHGVHGQGVRALLIEPGATRNEFENNIRLPDQPITAYKVQRNNVNAAAANLTRNGDGPKLVAHPGHRHSVYRPKAESPLPGRPGHKGHQHPQADCAGQRARRTDPQDQRNHRLTRTRTP